MRWSLPLRRRCRRRPQQLFRRGTQRDGFCAPTTQTRVRGLELCRQLAVAEEPRRVFARHVRHHARRPPERLGARRAPHHTRVADAAQPLQPLQPSGDGRGLACTRGPEVGDALLERAEIRLDDRQRRTCLVRSGLLQVALDLEPPQLPEHGGRPLTQLLGVLQQAGDAHAQFAMAPQGLFGLRRARGRRRCQRPVGLQPRGSLGARRAHAHQRHADSETRGHAEAAEAAEDAPRP
jgi:hypothetical protein